MPGRVLISAAVLCLAAVSGIVPAFAASTVDLSVANGDGDGTTLSPANATAELYFDVEQNVGTPVAGTVTLTPPTGLSISAVKLDATNKALTCTQSGQVWTCTVPKTSYGLVDVYSPVPKHAPLATSNFSASVAPPSGVTDSDSSNNSATAPLQVIPTVTITGLLTAPAVKLSTKKLGNTSVPVGKKILFNCTVTNTGPDNGADLTLYRNALPNKGSTGWTLQDKATGKFFKYQLDKTVSLDAGQSATVHTYLTLTKATSPKLFFGCGIESSSQDVHVVEQVAWPQDGFQGVGAFVTPKK